MHESPFLDSIRGAVGVLDALFQGGIGPAACRFLPLSHFIAQKSVSSVCWEIKTLRPKPTVRCGNRCGCGLVLLFALGCSAYVSGQSEPAAPPASLSATALEAVPLAQWEGMPIRSITFQGVVRDRLRPLPEQFSRMLGTPLDRAWLRVPCAECLPRAFMTPFKFRQPHGRTAWRSCFPACQAPLSAP